MVPITLSQIEFSFGERGDDFRTRKPNALIDSSRCLGKCCLDHEADNGVILLTHNFA